MDSRKGSFPLNHCKLGHKPLHIKKVVVGQLLLLQDEERLQLLQEEQLIPLACIFSPETKLQRGPEPCLFLPPQRILLLPLTSKIQERSYF